MPYYNYDDKLSTIRPNIAAKKKHDFIAQMQQLKL